MSDIRYLKRLTPDEAERFGFQWGPMQVIRLAHVKGSGYWLRVLTPGGVVNIRASEKGQRIEAHTRAWSSAERRAIAKEDES